MAKRRPSGYWTKNNVHIELIQRHVEGKCMQPKEISEDDKGLYQAVNKFYSSWSQLYQELDIDVQVRERKPRGYWTKETVTSEIKAWSEKGHLLNVAQIVQDNPSLYHAAVDQYSSWSNALQSAGINIEDVALHKKQGTWTPEYVIAEIQRMASDGCDLSPKWMYAEYSSLYSYGISIFGGWDKALLASGQNPEEIYEVRRPKDYWTKENIIPYLVDRHKKGYSISANKINSAGFGSLYRLAIRHYGSWSNVRSEVKKYIWENS